MAINRGEVREYSLFINRPNAATKRLVLSADVVNHNPDLPTVLALHVFDEDRGGLLSVRIGEAGWASALSPEASLKSRMSEVVHVCTEEELDAARTALMAAFDL